jgi:hypothetical protein
MVEATPATWRDVCERCGRGFNAGESRWIEERRYLVHTQCADWSRWAEPPYAWKLKERRARIVKAGKTIRAAQAEWPTHAVEHVQRVLEAVHRLG